MTRTDGHGILTILIRAAALWIAGSAAVNSLVMYRFVRTWTGTTVARDLGDTVLFFVAMSMPWLLATALWIGADLLARMTLARRSQATFESDVPVAQWQMVAFSCIGLWFAASGMLELVRALAVWISFGALRARTIEFGSWAPGVAVFEALVQLTIGLVLVFGARGIVGLIEHARGRHGSTPPTNPSPDDDPRR